MVQEMQFYSDQPWKISTQGTSMNMHASHNAIPQQTFGHGGYNYSPSNIYNTATFPYNPSMQNITHTVQSGSPQDFTGFSVPPYQVDHSQYLNNAQSNALPSGSSTADSNGSIVSEFDINRNSLKKRRKPAPTIATGRRNLKDENVNIEEADRRDKRRERNRKSAQRCRERKIEKKDALEKQISETTQTCNKYIELAENVLKAWKQRLNVLNEKLPCHTYTSQLSVTDFENLIEMMHNRHKEEPVESVDSVDVNNLEHTNKYTALPPQMNASFIGCPKLEPYYTPFENELNANIHPSYDQYCLQEANITYI